MLFKNKDKAVQIFFYADLQFRHHYIKVIMHPQFQQIKLIFMCVCTVLKTAPVSALVAVFAVIFLERYITLERQRLHSKEAQSQPPSTLCAFSFSSLATAAVFLHLGRKFAKKLHQHVLFKDEHSTVYIQDKVLNQSYHPPALCLHWCVCVGEGVLSCQGSFCDIVHE